jgi:hypothetical protein
LPLSSTSQIHDPKMKVDPVKKIMLSRSVELLVCKSAETPLPSVPAVDVLPPIACHGGTRDSCSGFGECRTQWWMQEIVDLYWFGLSTVIE